MRTDKAKKNTLLRKQEIISWFQTFAVIWILYLFFWVFPRRQIVVRRRFGTLYQFHLQRLALHPAFEDGTDTGFRNVGQLQFDAGEIPRRKYTRDHLFPSIWCSPFILFIPSSSSGPDLLARFHTHYMDRLTFSTRFLNIRLKSNILVSTQTALDFVVHEYKISYWSFSTLSYAMPSNFFPSNM